MLEQEIKKQNNEIRREQRKRHKTTYIHLQSIFIYVEEIKSGFWFSISSTKLILLTDQTYLLRGERKFLILILISEHRRVQRALTLQRLFTNYSSKEILKLSILHAQQNRLQIKLKRIFFFISFGLSDTSSRYRFLPLRFLIHSFFFCCSFEHCSFVACANT